MKESSSTPESEAPITRDEMLSGLFAHLVMQQTNLALMLLGRVPHPETGKTERDLDGARMFIDQLEMLEAKTRGNLVPVEERLLKESLTAVRLAFVEVVNQEGSAEPVPSPDASGTRAKPVESGAEPSPAEPAGDRRTKFSKSY